MQCIQFVCFIRAKSYTCQRKKKISQFSVRWKWGNFPKLDFTHTLCFLSTVNHNQYNMLSSNNTSSSNCVLGWGCVYVVFVHNTTKNRISRKHLSLQRCLYCDICLCLLASYLVIYSPLIAHLMHLSWYKIMIATWLRFITERNEKKRWIKFPFFNSKMCQE